MKTTMKLFSLSLIFLFLTCGGEQQSGKRPAFAKIDTAEPSAATPPPVTRPGKIDVPGTGNGITHQLWDELLRAHVSSTGKVDYTGFKKDEAKLNRYLQKLADTPVQDDWSRNEKLAYWINAYNAFTVKLIVKNYPVSSIRDLHNGNPWKVEWIELGGKTHTLDNIEHDIIRPKFNDPRIHFAVNCAAHSCPPLHNRAYTAGRLDQQLDQQTRQFINNPKYNQLSPDRIVLSKIFEWYAQDFDNLIDFLNQYAEVEITEDAKVAYMEYSWKLNE